MTKRTFLLRFLSAAAAIALVAPRRRGLKWREEPRGYNPEKFDFDHPTRTWRFGDCIVTEGEFQCAALQAQLIAEGDTQTRVIAVPGFGSMPVWFDEYRSSPPAGKTRLASRIMKLFGLA